LLDFPSILELDKYIKPEDKNLVNAKEKKRFKLVRKPSPIILLKYLLDWCIEKQEVKDEAIHNALLYLPYHHLKGNIATGTFVGTVAEGGKTTIEIKVEKDLDENDVKSANRQSAQDSNTYGVKGTRFKMALEGSRGSAYNIGGHLKATLEVVPPTVGTSVAYLHAFSIDVKNDTISESQYMQVLAGENMEVTGLKFKCKIAGDTPFKGSSVDSGTISIRFEDRQITQISMVGTIKLTQSESNEKPPVTDGEKAVLYVTVSYKDKNSSFKLPTIAGSFKGTITDVLLTNTRLQYLDSKSQEYAPVGDFSGIMHVKTIGDKKSIETYIKGTLQENVLTAKIMKRPPEMTSKMTLMEELDEEHYQGVMVNINLNPAIAEGIQHMFMKYLFDIENGEKVLLFLYIILISCRRCCMKHNTPCVCLPSGVTHKQKDL
jgi:hypothetical protein